MYVPSRLSPQHATKLRIVRRSVGSFVREREYVAQYIFTSSSGLPVCDTQLLSVNRQRFQSPPCPKNVLPKWRRCSTSPGSAVILASTIGAFEATLDTYATLAGTDPIGVELAGALKNVYAIAAGIADGLGFENNTRAGKQQFSIVIRVIWACD